jgi:hypothetical protein
VDETSIKVKGRWADLCRAVDKQGLTVDFLLSEHRDTAAAKRFFIRAMKGDGAPERITLDGYPATHSAVGELKKHGVFRPPTKVWTSKYLNNLVEQDHRRVKQRIYQMLCYIAGGKSQQFTILKIDTVFIFYKPQPPHSKFVDSFWLYQGNGAEHKIERILPTGTLELAINLRENELGLYDADRPENCSRFSGAVVSGAHGRGFAPDTAEAFIIGLSHVSQCSGFSSVTCSDPLSGPTPSPPSRTKYWPPSVKR